MNQDTHRANPKLPSVDRLSQLWRRINDYKIAQWSVAYVALAYGVQHAVILTSESFEWPRAVARISMLLLVLGLPVVMTLAWYHGERASRRISGPELTIISILLVMSSLLFYVFVRPSAELTSPAVQQAGVTAARAASISPAGAISIAVLPFTNLSGDAGQEFFSDGMTEEITSALAKIPDLRVVGRTSAFEFKGQNKDLRSIGQALSATHLLEGSVRKEGNRLRITAQLIKADDGIHIWTDNYDRELTGVFAIQEDIARAIAGALRMPLGLAPGEQLVSSRISNVDNYEQYLRSKVLLRDRAQGARQEMEALVARDPNFAPAWALIAEGNEAGAIAATRRGGSIEEMRKSVQSSLANGEMAARKAIALDPSLPSGYATLGVIQYRRAKWGDGESLLRQALALDAGNPEALNGYSALLAFTGRLKESLALRVQLRTLEPFSLIYNINTADIMRLAGQNEAAIAILEAIPSDIRLNYNRNAYLAASYAAEGQYTKAADTILLIHAQVPRQQVEDAARLLRTAPAKVKAPENLPALDSELNFVYAHIGAHERIIEFSEKSLKIGNVTAAARQLWDPLYAPLRKTERFKAYARSAGLVAYWRARGWPDLCRPVGANDFVCD